MYALQPMKTRKEKDDDELYRATIRAINRWESINEAYRHEQHKQTTIPRIHL